MKKIILIVLLAAGCESSPSEITLSWSFGQQELGCADAKVQTVHVFIGPLQPSGSYDAEVECTAGEHELRVRGVSPGRHVLFLKGVANNFVLFTMQQDVDVPASGSLGKFVVPEYVPL